MSRAVASPSPFSAKTLRAASRSLVRFWALRSSRRPAGPTPDSDVVTPIRSPSNSQTGERVKQLVLLRQHGLIQADDDLPHLAAGRERLVCVRGLVQGE